MCCVVEQVLSWCLVCNDAVLLFVVCSSCLNGGTCVDGINAYTCQCPTSFTGAYCQTRLTPCSSNPCLNSGTCVNSATAPSGSYLCHCTSGFTGARCENFVDWCGTTAGYSTCRNGATCVQLADQFQCICPIGWTGTICDVTNTSCAVAAARGLRLSTFIPKVYYLSQFDFYVFWRAVS